MEQSFYDVMRLINENIEFFKGERDFASKKMDELRINSSIPNDYKDEMIKEWQRIMDRMEAGLNDYLAIKKEVVDVCNNDTV
jgi:hypothetical protein